MKKAENILKLNLKYFKLKTQTNIHFQELLCLLYTTKNRLTCS